MQQSAQQYIEIRPFLLWASQLQCCDDGGEPQTQDPERRSQRRREDTQMKQQNTHKNQRREPADTGILSIVAMQRLI